MKRWGCRIAAAVLGLTFIGASSWARVLLQEDFEKAGAKPLPGVIVETDRGKAWRPASYGSTKDLHAALRYLRQGAIDPERGTIEIELIRDNKERAEALLSFLDNTGETIKVVQIFWSGFRRKEIPEIKIEGSDPSHLWQSDEDGGAASLIPLGRAVSQGERVHLVFTWGPSGSQCGVYMNGTPIDVRGEEPIGMRQLLLRTSELAVGAEIDAKWGTTFHQIRSPIAYFRIHDAPLPPGSIPAEFQSLIQRVEDDTFKVAGISGKLVAGDKVSVELKALPGGVASFDMGRVTGIPLAEVPPTEGAPGVPAVEGGTYRGSYTVKPGDDYENGQVVGRFTSADNVAADPVLSDAKWTIDTKPVVTFAIDRKDLPADSASKARIKLKAADANGNPVAGRHLKLTLSTTEEYTGLVGAGDFGETVGATVEARWKGETDAWGEVEFDYKAGFAAKTVILQAKDLDSGGVSVDYLTAYKEAAIDIALTPPVNRAAARRGIQYVLKVEASRTELTADGRSRSTVRATLLDPSGAPVGGDPVSFALSSENGTLRVIKGTTDASGVAIADYIAGKRIGIVVVSATATLRNAQGSVSILLLSDAPAKILLAAKPSSLPADGFSRADVSVKVTDVNDNPNSGTKVEFRVAQGGGKLEYPERVTDRFGDTANRYTSGTTPGIARVVATVRSKVPTETELAKARTVLFVPWQGDEERVRVEKWLKRKGESFKKDEPLAEYTAGREKAVKILSAPFDGTLAEILAESWDEAEVGQTLAVLIPTAL